METNIGLITHQEDICKSAWVRYIKNRIKKQKNFLCLISGEVGSGKSLSAISICLAIDPSFNIDRVVFTADELMQLINSGTLPKKKGLAILFDDAGVSLSSRRWMEKNNVLINFLIQTFRHQGFVLFFTCPHLQFLDSNVRKMFNGEFETAGIDRKKKLCILKPYHLIYRAWMREPRHKYMRVYDKWQMGRTKLERWGIPMPPDAFIKQYEAKKTQYTTQLNLELMAGFKKPDSKKEAREKSARLMLDPNADPLQYIIYHKYWANNIINQSEIARLEHTSQQNISKSSKKLMKRGFHPADFTRRIHKGNI